MSKKKLEELQLEERSPDEISLDEETYLVTFSPSEGGYLASCSTYPHIWAIGDSRREALECLEETIALMESEYND